MRYLMIFRTDPTKQKPPTENDMVVMGKFIDELATAGILLATDGLVPTSKEDARVRLANGKVTVVDGPFTETKELVGGFAIMQIATRAKAIEITERFLKLAGDGECEVRQMYDEPAFPKK
jgi:hypothetical protein